MSQRIPSVSSNQTPMALLSIISLRLRLCAEVGRPLTSKIHLLRLQKVSRRVSRFQCPHAPLQFHPLCNSLPAVSCILAVRQIRVIQTVSQLPQATLHSSCRIWRRGQVTLSGSVIKTEATTMNSRNLARKARYTSVPTAPSGSTDPVVFKFTQIRIPVPDVSESALQLPKSSIYNSHF
jgi:hypothetical protein